MKIGISLACFYPEHPEEVISKVSSLGFDTAELFLNTLYETEDSYIKDFLNRCEKSGLEIYSLHPFTSALENYMFFSPYDRRIKDSMVFYERYCHVAKFLGAKVINIHGDRGMGLKDIDAYCECLKPFAQISDKYGIIFSHENVFFNSINHPGFVEKLKQKLGDNIKFTFDIKQANKGGTDPYKLCSAMGDSIANFHINDFDDNNICLLPGFGNVDHKKIVDIIKSNGYCGPALIEVYRNNFKSLEDIEKSVYYLKNVI